MARTRGWRVVLVVVVLLAVVGLLARFGPPDWLLADEHPVRNVLEGLSWPAGVLALVWVAVPSVWRWWRPAPDPAQQSGTGQAGATASGSVSQRAGTVSGTSIQVGGNVHGGIRVGESASAPRERPRSDGGAR